jgi:hypothetical protein
MPDDSGVSQWLPTGHHWGLHIVRHDLSHLTGPLIPTAGDKLIWHTTEGSFASAASKFQTGADIPHVLISPSTGAVIQYLPFDCFSKALEHPSGTPETNRAGCRQVEIAGSAAAAATWPTDYYRRLGALAVLIEHRTGIRRANYHTFKIGARRLTPVGFLRAKGHLGHEHVPNNSHWDPGAFRFASLVAGMKWAEKQYL